ncbi:MAG TPA: FkbM family methyltransferase [Thermoflexales bacterium]|nr:FkbM family methyltransferase [Thermoflexales bacterium]HQX09050.1 FkbM family methyltransferase [Thermoflexales bacterium]HQZ52072.1 FkbM family methyltransferase [Thermoflexales bacterium]HRA55218.1 FkbM family methyltransferase [Thermoflexales bacterium]
MSLLRRFGYYARSIPVALSGFANPLEIAVAALRGKPFIAELRSGDRFAARTAMDAWVIKETCLDRDYERDGFAIQNGWTVVDIGAGLGDFTISVARRFPNGRVLAFEPFGESFALLERNIALNEVPNVTARRLAIGGVAGVARLSLGTGVAVQHSTARASDPGHAERVDEMPLGAALDAADVSRCDFLKLDCEGAEYAILRQAAADGTLHRVRRISMEYHDGITDGSGAWLADFLRAHGFTVTLEPNPAHADIGFLRADYATKGA